MTIPRRLVSDLKVLYSLEPTLKDIFVEGNFDKEIIDQYIKFRSIEGVKTYNIDSVEVSDQMVLISEGSLGQKQRVIYLMKLLVDIKELYLFGIVDKDFDDWLKTSVNLPNLKYTSYNSLELHFFSNEFVRDILKMTKARINNSDSFFLSFCEVLKTFYSLRIASVSTKLHLKFVPWDKSLTLTNDKILFDFNSFITKLLISNGKIGEKEKFSGAFRYWLDKFTGNDPRHYVHGHDFIALLSWSIIKAKGLRSLSSEEALERLLVFRPEALNDFEKIVK